MSLLSIVQQVASKVLGTIPTTITAAIGSADSNIQQIVSYVNEEGRQLGARAAWQVLREEATFTTLNQEDQGSILSIAGPDFLFVVNETFWDRSTRRPVFGPKTAAEWQQLKAQLMQGPWYQFTLRGNHILFIPVPAAGDACFFEWVSKFWCTDLTGVGKSSMTVDTDVAVLDEDIITLGTIWRFKQDKGLPWQDDADKYEAAVADAIARDGVKSRINLGGVQSDIYPGIIVPTGNWPISGEPSA